MTFTVETATNPLEIFPLGNDKLTNSAVPPFSGNSPVTLSLKAGYHRINYDGAATSGSYTGNFQTDPYTCPFTSLFFDTYGVFSGCTLSPSVSGVLINLHAQYVIQAHACGVRQFFNGTCNNVDSACNTFNTLSGACFTCADTSISPDASGRCIPPVVVITCSANQHQVGSQCIPDTCASVDTNNRCISCVSVIY